MLIQNIAASPVHRIVITCNVCPLTMRWAGTALAMRFGDTPDLTLAEVKAAAICSNCGGEVSVVVERSDEDYEPSA